MKSIPFEFVLERLAPAKPYTKPMFGSLAVYVGEKIVVILRHRESSPQDNGVWLATTEEHHSALKPDFPNMRSIALFESPVTGWQVLPEDSSDFESAAELACELILRGDPRIGKVPGARKAKKKKVQVKRKTGKASAGAKRSASARGRRRG